MRYNTSLLQATFAVAAAAIPSAHAQSLDWTIVTESVRFGDTSEHTEHARPPALRDLLMPSQNGVAINRTTILWSITATNTTASPITFRPWMDSVTVYISDGNCWGIDFLSEQYRPTDDLTLASGATATFSGTNVQPDAAPGLGLNFCFPDDGLHIAPSPSRVFAGPTVVLGWSGPTGVQVTDAGTTFRTEVEILTRYELPLIDGAGLCTPLVPNSTGAAGQLSIYGAADPTDGYLVLAGSDLPSDVVAFPVLADSTGPVYPIAFGQASLCLGSPISRYLGGLTLTENGTYSHAVEPQDLPLPPGGLSPGSQGAFQLIYRDLVGGAATANSSTAAIVTF